MKEETAPTKTTEPTSDSAECEHGFRHPVVCPQCERARSLARARIARAADAMDTLLANLRAHKL